MKKITEIRLLIVGTESAQLFNKLFYLIKKLKEAKPSISKNEMIDIIHDLNEITFKLEQFFKNLSPQEWKALTDYLNKN